MSDTLPDCEKCGLGNHPVPDDGGDYTILVVGEAPGAEESKQGKPFVGQSGKLLRKAMTQIGFPMEKVTFTNIVKCRPPDNKIQRRYITSCYRSLPIKNTTEIVILCGNTPLQAVLGETGITTWNGIPVERDGIIYIPVLHPAFVLRDENHMDAWLAALDTAYQAYRSGVKKAADSQYTIEYPTGNIGLLTMEKELMASPVISMDTEVDSLDPWAKGNALLMMSFATGDRAYAVAVNHPDDMCPLNEGEKNILRRILIDHPFIVGHNIKFDQMQVDRFLGVQFDAMGDTMLCSFLAETKKGIHGLKRLAGMYLGMYDYDSPLTDYQREHPEADPSKGGHFSEIPLALMLEYAAKDAIATYQLHPVLLEKLTKKQRTLYEELYIPISNSLYRMCLNGMEVDHATADRYRRIYASAMADTVERIREDPQVKKYAKKRATKNASFVFNPGSWQQKAVVLYGSQSCPFLTRTGKDWSHVSGKYYGVKPQDKTGKGDPSTARGVLELYEDECPLVKDLIWYEILKKALGTYIEPIALGTKLSGDGRARSSFNMHVVETGRISSSGFTKTLGINQQNIPTPDTRPDTLLEYQPIKNMFTSRFKEGMLLNADYAGMELRVFASLANCQGMLDILNSDVDFHTEVASRVLRIPYDQVTKPQRKNCKAVSFLMLYGGSEYALWRTQKVPLDEGRELLHLYFNTFPEIKGYLDYCTQFVTRHGYIENPFGLRRYLPDINSLEKGKREAAKREAVNTPVQGGAGMLTLMALVAIDWAIYGAGLHSLLINTVHDSILTDVYPGEMPILVEIQREAMENLPKWASEYMPHIDLSWLTCPLKADFEMGTHYGAMEPYDWARHNLVKKNAIQQFGEQILSSLESIVFDDSSVLRRAF